MMTGLLILAILGVASAGRLGQGHHTSQPAPVVVPVGIPPIITVDSLINGVMRFEGLTCILRGGEMALTGPIPILIGSSGVVEIGAGFGHSLNGARFHISDGLVHVRTLSPSDVQGVRLALARSGLTYEEFVQQTGTLLPGQGIMEITAGVVNIDGVYRNIDVGLVTVVGRSGPATGPVTGPATGPATGPVTGPATGPVTGPVTGPATGPVTGPVNGPATGPVTGPATGPVTGPTGPITGPVTGPTGPITGPVIGLELTVTVTASPVTQTIHRPVTLIKTTTLDRYITITSPVYNTVAATITNVVKQTVLVTEDQVIRSQLPGRVVVNTVPGETQVVLTVTDTNTQYFVQTAFETVTSTLQHLAPNFNFSTVTVNNPQTSTVVQIITRTSVATAFVTRTLDSTIQSTATAVFTVTAAPINVQTPGYY